MSSAILLDINSKIATITLNRPEKLNAFDDATLSAWIDALKDSSSVWYMGE